MGREALEVIKIHEAEFLRGCSSLAHCPDDDLPEIALIGRSNAGKSTFLNRILERRKLARVSSTPGRTQEINFFRVKISSGGTAQDFLFADLPGFGYAKFAKSKREALAELCVEYIVERRQLIAVALLNDCRRGPAEEELAVRDLAQDAGRHLLIVATKLDKLKRSQHEKELARLAASYGLEAEDLVLSGEGVGTEQFWNRIFGLV